VFTQGGGVHGAAIQAQMDEEDEFQRAIEMADRRQRMARAARMTQEADLDQRRRLQSIGLIGGGISRLGSTFGGLAAGLGQQPLVERPGAGTMGDQNTLLAEDRYFGGRR